MNSSPVNTTQDPQTLLYNAHISTLEEQMLDAFELFQYSMTFRNMLVAISLEEKSLENLLTDFQVLHASQILLLVVIPHTKTLQRKVSVYTKNGVPVHYYSLPAHNPPSVAFQEKIKETLSSLNAVIIGIEGIDNNSSHTMHLEKSLEFASTFSAKKFFYVHKKGALVLNEKSLSHISTTRLENELKNKDTHTNINKKIIDTLLEGTIAHKFETVVLDDSPGALFQELFTHQGRGTLITEDYPNEIRHGHSKDIFMVSRIMKPYIEAGILLPLSEKELSSQIRNFLLYTINGSIIAGARMVDYNEAAELSKFFCLPRFRRQGHARCLCQAFIKKAQSLNKKYIFSLSISQGMWEFLKSLGFNEVNREELPNKWQSTYNFKRESKAFILKLPPQE